MQKPGPQQGCALCRGAAEAKHQSGQECMTDGACQMDNPQYYCTMRTLGTTTTAMMIKWRRTKRQSGNSRSLEREIPPMLFCTKQSWISFKGCRTSDSRGKYSTKARKASNERSHEHMPCYLGQLGLTQEQDSHPTYRYVCKWGQIFSTSRHVPQQSPAIQCFHMPKAKVTGAKCGVLCRNGGF